MNYSKKDLLQFKEVASDIAIQAGRILLQYQKKLSSLKINHKNALGVVSEADIKAESIIFQTLKKKFPTHEFLGEEGAYKKFGTDRSALEIYKDKEWCWVVDPLDGTSNYLCGLDYYAVCIGLLNFGKPVLGIVYRPRTSQLYSAVSGDGAYIQNLANSPRRNRLKESTNLKKMSDAMLVTGFACEKGEVFESEFEQFVQLMKDSRGIRRLGSAALDLCLVAEGVFDGFWERGLAPWDTAAAQIICQEAGVKLSDYDGREYSPFDLTLIAAKNPFHKKLSKSFSYMP